MLPEAGSQQIDQVFPLWRAVCNSKQGTALKEQERWAKYKPEQMKKVGEWEDVFGYDVNNLVHMRLTDCIAIAVVDSQNEAVPGSFSREDKKILRKTALTHDLAEAKTGDKNFESKTDVDDEEELQLMRSILGQKCFRKDISKKEKEQIILIMKDKTSRLGETFNVIESIGYFRTAMVTWRKSKLPEHQASGVSENLILITNNVLLNQIPKLLDKSKKFVLVERILDFFKDRISEAFKNMPPEIFDKYEPELREKNREKFEAARIVWNNYLMAKKEI